MKLNSLDVVMEPAEVIIARIDWEKLENGFEPGALELALKRDDVLNRLARSIILDYELDMFKAACIAAGVEAKFDKPSAVMVYFRPAREGYRILRIGRIPCKHT